MAGADVGGIPPEGGIEAADKRQLRDTRRLICEWVETAYRIATQAGPARARGIAVSAEEALSAVN